MLTVTVSGFYFIDAQAPGTTSITRQPIALWDTSTTNANAGPTASAVFTPATLTVTRP